MRLAIGCVPVSPMALKIHSRYWTVLTRISMSIRCFAFCSARKLGTMIINHLVGTM